MEIDAPDDAATGAGAGTTAKRKGHPTPNPDSRARGPNRTRILATITIRNPPWSYAHLTVANPPSVEGAISTSATTRAAKQPTALDVLEIRAYLTAALRQFLGDTGAGIPVDILAVGGADDDDDNDGNSDRSGVWVRVPRQDLNLFVGAVTAYAGQPTSGQKGNRERMVLQVKAAGNWLGSLLGRGQESKLWAGLDTSEEGGS
ncbi:hypothetical protein VTH82DRAFT_5189 [Thermothelomyces myriococcoides]